MDMLKHLKINVEMNSNNTLMSLRIGNDKLLEKYKTIWTKTEDLKKKLN